MTTDFLSSIVKKMEETGADIDSIVSSRRAFEKIEKLDPCLIGNWEHRDRQDFELGNIDLLAESIVTRGQAQPIVVVRADDIFKCVSDEKCDFIVIAGYRRWLACKSKGIMVDAIVRNLNFEQAISCLISENEKENVSDYSKGMFFYNLLNQEKCTKKSLFERLGMKKSTFDNYLSFAEVPKEVWEAVGNLTKVSARTASTIRLICQKGEKHKKAVISIANKISDGIGEKTITNLVNSFLARGNDNKKTNATRVALSNNISVDYAKKQLKISFKGMSESNIHLIQEKISHYLKELVNEQ